MVAERRGDGACAVCLRILEVLSVRETDAEADELVAETRRAFDVSPEVEAVVSRSTHKMS
jgi:hypothetical protein